MSGLERRKLATEKGSPIVIHNTLTHLKKSLELYGGGRYPVQVEGDFLRFFGSRRHGSVWSRAQASARQGFVYRRAGRPVSFLAVTTTELR